MVRWVAFAFALLASVGFAQQSYQSNRHWLIPDRGHPWVVTMTAGPNDALMGGAELISITGGKSVRGVEGVWPLRNGVAAFGLSLGTKGGKFAANWVIFDVDSKKKLFDVNDIPVALSQDGKTVITRSDSRHMTLHRSTGSRPIQTPRGVFAA